MTLWRVQQPIDCFKSLGRRTADNFYGVPDYDEVVSITPEIKGVQQPGGRHTHPSDEGRRCLSSTAIAHSDPFD